MRLRSAASASLLGLLAVLAGCTDEGYTISTNAGQLVVTPLFAGTYEGFPATQFAATVDGAPVAVTWGTSDAAVATVSPTGLVTPLNDGFAAITATLVSNTSRMKSASFTVNPLLGTALTSGVAVNGIGGAIGDMSLLYRIYVPAGTTLLTVQLSGGSGDLDIYVRDGAVPDYDDWDCRPWAGGNNETCSFPNPTTGGVYYIWIDVYDTAAGASLVATLTP
jgi:hypothetical protein